MLTSPLFEPFAESERKALIERFEFLEIEQASLLIKKGRAPGGFYVLLSGEVLADQQGRLRRLGPGATFGGPDLLQGRPSKTDVLASKKCFALFLSEKVFRELIMTHPMVLEVISNQPDPAAGVPDVWNHHLTLF
jgi:CRP-like cAMP-binding protein